MNSRIFRLIPALFLVACGDSNEPVTPAFPVRMDVVSGQSQSGVVGTQLSSPLVVKALDASGNPIAGQIVNFVVVSGGGSVFAGAAQTNAQGNAQELWTLGQHVTDSQKVEVRAVNPSTGAPQVFGVFTATPVAGAPDTVAIVSGDGQQAMVGSAAADSLKVRVADRFGNAGAGISVNWTICAQGSVSPANSTTDAAGLTATRATAGPTTGACPVTATAGARSRVFGLTIVAPVPTTLLKHAGDLQWAASGDTLAIRPTVRLLDDSGRALPGEVVSFAVAGGNGSLSSANVTTDTNGYAAVRWTLGSASSQNRLVASVAGLTASFTASLGRLIVTLDGPIKDVRGDSALYVDQATGRNLRIRRISTQLDVVLMNDTRTFGEAFLMPAGAIFREETGFPPTANLFEWRHGLLSQLATSLGPELEVMDHYALFMRSDGANRGVHRRNLLTGTDTLLDNSALSEPLSVGPNGDAVFSNGTNPPAPYSSTSGLVRVRNGVLAWLSSATDTVKNTFPVTDGFNVAYVHFSLRQTTPPYWLLRTDGSVTDTLAGPYPCCHRLREGTLNNGWIAYGWSTGGAWQVRTRSPAGVIATIPSPYTESPAIAAVGSNGEVFFYHNTGNNELYFSSPPYTSITLVTREAPSFRVVKYDNGRFVLMNGASAYELRP